ncbi:MAG: hypothetical protein HPY80_00385 [Bacteroidales bacterium]|jgi:hypothetical protein|nr:hypothetical protein [Bacteroidales bacterium]
MKKKKHDLGIKSRLKHGDLKKIAEITGFAYHHVVNAFNGHKPLHPILLETARMIIEQRSKRISEMVNQLNK